MVFRQSFAIHRIHFWKSNIPLIIIWYFVQLINDYMCAFILREGCV